MCRKTYIFFVCLTLFACLGGCKPKQKAETVKDKKELPQSELATVEPTSENISLAPVIDEVAPPDTSKLEDTSFVALAFQIVQLLSEKDLEGVITHIDPEGGLVFSPYAYIDSPQIWSSAQLVHRTSDSTYHWGYYDGSGDSILMNFDEYYRSFVYCADFLTNVDTAVNQPAHHGNSLNNFEETFPGAFYIDFHVEGTEEYGYLDWRILRLGFIYENHNWYLIAIIHDEWTI